MKVAGCDLPEPPSPKERSKAGPRPRTLGLDERAVKYMCYVCMHIYIYIYRERERDV